MWTNRLVVGWLTLTALLVAPAASAQSTQLSGTGSVEYHLIHKFHKVVGKSRSMAVRGAVDQSGLKAMARAQVRSFDSDNANRDEHMLETMEAEKYPWVSVRVALPGFKLPTSATSTKLTVQSAIELHGVTVNHPIELRLDTKDGVHFQVGFQFAESLTAHRIERPKLLFVPVDDLLTIIGKAELTAKR